MIREHQWCYSLEKSLSYLVEDNVRGINLGGFITLHSYGGGTGKTSLAIALAEIFSMKGKRVCLIDLDCSAPSTCFAFELEKADFWINDYLNGVCGIENVLVDVTDKCGYDGQLFICPANFRTEAIRDITSKDRKWEMKALGRLLSLKTTLLTEMGLDYVIFDTSSGIQYSSINAIVSSDIVILVDTTDKLQVKGTQIMVDELYELFEKKTGILLNKVLVGRKSLAQMEALSTLEYENLYNFPVLGVIPCSCEIPEVGIVTFFRKRPAHFFTRTLEKIALRVDSFASGAPVERNDSKLKRIYRERLMKKVTGLRM